MLSWIILLVCLIWKNDIWLGFTIVGVIHMTINAIEGTVDRINRVVDKKTS